MDTFYDSWEVVCRNDKGEEKKFAVNTRQTDPTAVVRKFLIDTKHPHRPFDLKPMSVYPVDRNGEKIADGPQWHDTRSTAIAEVAGTAE